MGRLSEPNITWAFCKDSLSQHFKLEYLKICVFRVQSIKAFLFVSLIINYFYQNYLHLA